MEKSIDRKICWLIFGFIVMAAIAAMPHTAGLTPMGQRVLAVLSLAIILWVSEAVSYPFSAVIITAALILLIGFSPDNKGNVIGTARAIPMALGGFVNAGWVLGTAGLFMAAGMLSTGLEKRIALNILKVVGTTTNAVFAGVMIVMLVLDFFIPAVSARSATMTPIAVGLISAFGVDPKSVFARMLLVTIALSSSISGIGLLSAGPPNPIAQSFIQSSLKVTITWGDWLIYAMPYCVALMAVLYLLVTKLNKFEFTEIPGGRAVIDKSLKDLGPISSREKRISIIFLFTIMLWATEAIHGIDANTVAVLSVALMLAPCFGIATWDELVCRVDWGTILLFGVGISLGMLLLDSGSALWLANTALGKLDLGALAPAWMLAVIIITLIIFRFAFTSITSATAALVPAILGFLLSMGDTNLPVLGMTLISTFTMYFGFVLPVNSPQAIIAYSTNTFEVKDMARIGIPLTVIGVALLVVFTFTYWHWLGLI